MTKWVLKPIVELRSNEKISSTYNQDLNTELKD